MEIANMVLQAINKGIPVVTDLDKKDLKIGNHIVIHDGFPTDGYELSYPKQTNMVALENLRTLYYNYKHSVPSERSVKRRKNFFPALPLDKLDESSFIMALDREEARVKLETEVLFNSVVGNLEWHDEYGSWYYKNKDFILMKTWF